MEIKSNLDELIARFEKIAEQAEAIDWADSLLFGINEAMAAMKFRIFNRRRDAEGDSLGRYMGNKERFTKKNREKFNKRKFYKDVQNRDGFTQWEKKRIRKGLQVTEKDLEFSGGLRRGIVTAKDGTQKAIIYIPNEELLTIAEGLELQTGNYTKGKKIPIFTLSEEEKEILKTSVNEALKRQYDRLFQNP